MSKQIIIMIFFSWQSTKKSDVLNVSNLMKKEYGFKVLKHKINVHSQLFVEKE